MVYLYDRAYNGVDTYIRDNQSAMILKGNDSRFNYEMDSLAFLDV